MLPIYASKVLAQAEPERYPEGTEGLRTLVKEGGPRALFRSLDTTFVGYSLYGGVTKYPDQISKISPWDPTLTPRHVMTWQARPLLGARSSSSG